jgi:hypothetical protein
VQKKPLKIHYLIFMIFPTEVLDGKEINPTARQFLVNWKATKDARKKKILSRQLTMGEFTNGMSISHQFIMV